MQQGTNNITSIVKLIKVLELVALEIDYTNAMADGRNKSDLLATNTPKLDSNSSKMLINDVTAVVSDELAFPYNSTEYAYDSSTDKVVTEAAAANMTFYYEYTGNLTDSSATDDRGSAYDYDSVGNRTDSTMINDVNLGPASNLK